MQTTRDRASDAPEAAKGGPAFSERLLERRARWWGRPFRWSSPESYRDAAHRTCERFATRTADDPPAAWHCCRYWQRTLIDKTASRAFARMHGCALPELYWTGRSIGGIPFDALPPRFVLRPARGTAAAGVYVIAGDRELLRDIALTRAALRRRLWREHGPIASAPLLVEAFVAPETGDARMPVEYKCHTFGETVGAVQVLERTGQLTGLHRYYTPRWEAFADPMDTHYPLAPPRAPPPWLDAMLDAAARMGRAIGTYMRIDFFGSAAGPVFNEFSSTPQVRGLRYTPCCEAHFGALWQARFPDAV